MQRIPRIARMLLRAQISKFFTQKIGYHYHDNNNHYRNKDEDLIHPTYTSKHFKVSSMDILQYLDDKKLEYKSQGKYVQLRYCPFCPKHNVEHPTNQYLMGINLENGSYNCFRASCQAKGSWFDFKNFMNGTLNRNPIPSNQTSNQKLNMFEYHTYFERLKLKEPKGAYEYLVGDDWENNQRGIRDDVLKKYLIGIDSQDVYDPELQQYVNAPLIYFPMFRYRSTHEKNKLQQRALKQKKEEVLDENSISEQQKNSIKQQLDKQFDNLTYELVSCKVRAAGSSLKHIQKIEPANAAKGIFGLHLLKPDSTQVILTEGEFDAMAAYQMTGIPAISLPYGINHIPAHLIEWLDQFEKLNDIIIWVDDDNPGRINSQKIARKLGNARTRVVQPSLIDPHDYPKDANDCLRFYSDQVNIYIEQSKSLLRKNITQFSDFKQLTKNRLLNFELSKGTPTKTFQTFNNTTKGLRTGEFTILTGPTGSGKTTFLSQLSLEFCREGITTLWGSFEIKSDRLAEHQLLQAFKTDVIKQKDLIDVAISRFETEIPIYYMNFYGSTDLDQIIDTIEYAIYEYNVTHVCLDNLQFMMGTQVSGNRKFDYQDEIIEKFRRLTSNNDIHLTLVIHPRKVDESEDLTIASVFGSAKATQEADNVFIIQNRPRYRVFEVKKNRYDGEIGRIGLGFDSSVKSFFELTSSEVKELNEEKSTILDIINKRKNEGRHFKQEITVNNIGPKGGNNNEGGQQGGNSNGGMSKQNTEPDANNNTNQHFESVENINIEDLIEIDEGQIEQYEIMASQYSNSQIQEVIQQEPPVMQTLDQTNEISKDSILESIQPKQQEQLQQKSIHDEIRQVQKTKQQEFDTNIEPSGDYLNVWKFDEESDYGLAPKTSQILPAKQNDNETPKYYNQQELYEYSQDPLEKHKYQNINNELDEKDEKDQFPSVDDQIELTIPQSKMKQSKKVSFVHVGKKVSRYDFNSDI